MNVMYLEVTNVEDGRAEEPGCPSGFYREKLLSLYCRLRNKELPLEQRIQCYVQ